LLAEGAAVGEQSLSLEQLQESSLGRSVSLHAHIRPEIISTDRWSTLSAWAGQATFPFDVIKTRMQATTRRPYPTGYMGKSSDKVVFGPYYSTWTTAKNSRKAGGWRVFYSGLGPTLLRAVVCTFALQCTPKTYH
jgi:hypothetical protein